MPSFEIKADIFTRLSVSDSPKGSSNTFKTHKNISLYFKRRYLIIYKYWLCTTFKENKLESSPLIPHSHQKSSCLKSGVSFSSTVSLPIKQENSTPLLRQLNFWCECGIILHKATILWYRYNNCFIVWLKVFVTLHNDSVAQQSVYVSQDSYLNQTLL